MRRDRRRGPAALLTKRRTAHLLTNERHEVFDKQDSELMAFYRLVPKLHTLFPRPPLVPLLDSRCANQNAIHLIASFRWMYVVNFMAEFIEFIRGSEL